MSLTPISRDSMLILRTQTLEKQRKNRIENIVMEIYHNAISVAEKTEDSNYMYQLPKLEFYKTNMVEIMDKLRYLFPGCSVKNTIMSKAKDGKIYDVSKIDENLKPFFQQMAAEFIIVDWS